MVREIDLNHDYETLARWWEAHQWPVVPKEHLPKRGFMVNETVAAFLYQTDSAIAWMEWIISDPASDSLVRDVALDLLIEHISKEARDLGFQIVLTLTDKPRLKNRLERLGFHVGDAQTATYLRRVNLCP